MSLAKTKHIEQPTVLYMDGVSVSFDGFKALNSLSLFIEPGEMRA
ncbi:MAG: ABC transporter ATP-binding protein, partial [Pseudomonadota bacterium]|nr:ABC transporter ATP-binding protein [Pseudomonadota bacterium]